MPEVPTAGDGGKGSDIVFVADDNLSTLIDFRYKRKYIAPDGEPGGAKRCSGKSNGAYGDTRTPRNHR